MAPERKLAQRMQQAPVIVRLVVWGLALAIVAVSIGLCLYWIITDSGPHAWLKARQLELFNAYYPKITALLTIVAGLAPTVGLLFLLILLAHIFVKPPPPAQE